MSCGSDVATRCLRFLAHNTTEEGKALLQSWQSVPGLDPTWPLGIEIEGWTSYTPEQAIACKGPGE